MSALRFRFPIVLACMVALALAGPAHAQQTFTNPASKAVSLSSFKFKKYNATVSVFKQSGKAATLFLNFDRRVLRSTQSHSYTFKKGVSVKLSPDLSSGRVTARGKYGRLSFKFAGNVGRLTRRPAGKGCTGGKSASQRGTVTGRMALSVDRAYFRGIKRSTGRATATSTAKSTCKFNNAPGSDPKGKVTLTAGGSGQGPNLSVTATKTNTTSSINVFSSTPSASHSLMIIGPASAFTYSPDLSSAKLHGTGAFASGSATFKANPGELCPGGSASGTLTGNLAFKFDTGNVTGRFATGKPASMFANGVSCTFPTPAPEPQPTDPGPTEPPPDEEPPPE